LKLKQCDPAHNHQKGPNLRKRNSFAEH